MCGRYFLKLPAELLQKLFGCENFISYTPAGNITPLQSTPLIVRRRMGLGRWGLLPDYVAADDKALCAKLKNARIETIAEKPTFSGLWQKGRRALVPASGFFEWPEIKVKGQPPYEVTAPAAEAIAFAAIWTKHDDLVTFTILTTAASPALAKIHSRMPVAFRPDQAEQWFAASPTEAQHMTMQDNIVDWQATRTEPLLLDVG